MRRPPDKATGGRDPGGRFTKGHGHARGRPTGSRNKATLLLDAAGEKAARAILRRVIKDAKAGNLDAAEMILRRAWPARKGRAVQFPLGKLEGPKDVSKALAGVALEVAAGTLTPEEGQQVSAILEARLRAISTVEIEERIAALEARLDGGADA